MMELLTVLGPVDTEAIRLADGHAHLWIEPVEGADTRMQLNDYDLIQAELLDFRAAGGTALIDCQPGGCGRDARMLRRLAKDTGLYVTAITGFHLQKYYPPDFWLWHASAAEAAAFFIEELTQGTRETAHSDKVRAALIKVGYEGSIEGQTRALMEAAAEASRQTGAAILFHTEQGKNVEALIPFFADRDVPSTRLYFCHVDKRPDVGLHRALAQAGVLLGYDTFARPKYDPENGVYPLMRTLVADGLDNAIAIGLDLAFSVAWRRYGGDPGLEMLPNQVIPRLRAEGYASTTILRLTAQNVARRLVWDKPAAR